MTEIKDSEPRRQSAETEIVGPLRISAVPEKTG